MTRLRDYLAQLPPKAQALLMREFERAIERDDDVPVALLVLEQLRLVVRASDDNERHRADGPSRLLFRPVEPFLVDNRSSLRPGQIRRSSLSLVWNWLANEAIVNKVAEFEKTVRSAAESGSVIEQAVHQLQMDAAAAIEQCTSSIGHGLSHIGGPIVIEDVVSIGIVLKNREALNVFGARIANNVRNLTDSELVSVQKKMYALSLQMPQPLPFTLSLLMQRLAAPWQIIRLAIAAAGSGEETSNADTAYGIAVTIVIQDLAHLVADLRQDIKHGRVDNLSHYIKTIHDGLRGLRTELDFGRDSAWDKQLSAIRIDISNTLRSELESIPRRVRQTLSQQPDESKLDPAEINKTATLIDFVAICRAYANELAINEVTLRTFSDLQNYIESATESLVESLRVIKSETASYRQMQVEAAIRFCDVLFGSDYALLMRKTAHAAISGEQMGVGERKSSRAS